MIDGGPLHGGSSAKLVINDEPNFLSDVMERFKSVVGIATLELDGKLTFQLINTDNGAFAEILHNSRSSTCVALPVFVLARAYNAPSDTAPEPVG